MYTIITIFFFLLETNFLAPFKIMDMKPNIIICAVISVAVLENTRFAAVYGLAAGLCADLAFGSPFMMSGLLYFFAAYVTSYMVRTYFNGTFITAIIAFIPVCIIREVVNAFYLLTVWNDFNIIKVLFYYLLPEFVYSAAFMIPVYFFIRLTAHRIKTENNSA